MGQPPPRPDAEEPIAELLARAVRWARGGRFEDAAASCAALLAPLADEAPGRLASALEHVRAGGILEGLAAAHLALSQWHEARQDWRSALDSFKRHAALRAAAARAQADALAQVPPRERRRDGDARVASAPASGTADRARPAMADRLAGRVDLGQLEAAVAGMAGRFPATPLMLLAVDLDQFGHVDETGSEATGDAVLHAVAGLLRAQSRPQDVLARTGGGAFVVALGGPVSTTRALLVAERLRASIEAHDWERVQPGLRVTASIGVAARAPGEPLDAALARADAVVRECRRGGRNQVRCSS